jgi:hypothetical protein
LHNSLERHLLEHASQAGWYGYPDVVKMRGCTVVLGLLGPKLPHVGQRAVEGSHYLGKGDGVAWPGEPIAAVYASLVGHKT